MLKKFIYGLCLLATVFGCSGVFTSCKDTNEDRFNEQQAEIVKLQAALEDLRSQMGTADGSLADRIAQAEALIAELQKKLNDITNPAGPDDKTIWSKNEIESMITTITQQLLADYATKDQIDALQAQIDALEKCSCDLTNYMKKEDFTASAVLELLGLTGQGQNLINLVGQTDALLGLAQQADAINELLGADLVERVYNLEQTTQALREEVNDLTTTLSDLSKQLFGDPATGTKGLFETVADLKLAVNDLQGDVADLMAYFTKADGTTYTVAEFQQALADAAWVGTNKTALETLVNYVNDGTINGQNLSALNKFLENHSFDQLANMYDALFPEGDATDWTNVMSYKALVDKVEANAQAIEQLQQQIDGVLGRLNTMVTSLILQATWDPILGSLNTPFGVNSYVLMTFYGNPSTQIAEFPANGVGAEFDSRDGEDERGFVDWASVPNVSFFPLPASKFVTTDENGQADLGKLWFTVNPGTVSGINVNNFSLVNSAENLSPVSLTNVVKDDETVLSFGYSRAAAGNGNGLYQAHATVNPDDLDAIAINLEPGMIQSLKDAINNRTIGSAAHLLKEVYLQVKDVCDAQALRYNYDAVTGYDANGNEIKEEQKVYSQYGIAATAIRPIGFTTLVNQSFRTLPEWKDIEIPDSMVNLGLKPFTIGDFNFNLDLNIAGIEINDVAQTIITVKVPKKFDVTVDPSGEGEATLPDGWENMPEYYDLIEVDITGDLQNVVDNLKNSIDEWLNGNTATGAEGLSDQINTAVQNAINEAFYGSATSEGLITSIENQVNEMMGDIQDKLYDLVGQINTDYIGKINRVGSYYQRLAARINKVLTDPNHYLQVMMMYRTTNGSLHRLSTDPSMATVFKGAGEAIELWPTSYNFEALCPIYKKFVGVTKVTYVDAAGNTQDLTSTLGAQANDHSNYMATAFTGERSQIALNVAGANKSGVYTYEIAYQGLDYRGHTSTNKYYIKLVRE